MSAIYKKELRQYLYSVTGSVFIAVNLFVIGLYFLAGNLLAMTPSLAPVMSGVIFILMLMIPVISMRVFAEERRQKTDQLLLTSPVSVIGIVAGKYLALLTIFMIPVAVSCILPLIMSFFGQVSYGESYTAVFGYFLYGASCLALGLFISSVTESQIVVAVLSFIALFVTYIMGGIVRMLTGSGKEYFNILSVLDFNSRLENMMNGIIDLKAIIYFMSIILLLLFFTVQSIEKRRYLVSKNTLSLTVYSSLSIVIAVVSVVVINLLSGRIPEGMAEYDVSEGRIYSLTESAKDAVKGLSEDVEIYVMGTKETLENYDMKELEKTLDQMDTLSGHLKVSYKDPSVEPDFARKYTDDQVSTGSIIVACGNKSKIISPYDLYSSEMDYSTYSEIRTAYDGEGQIISGISYVTGNENPKIYALTGHEELSTEDFPALKQLLSKRNIEAENLNLMKASSVPEDAEALLILSPGSDLHEEDMAPIKDYLKKGGKAIITADYSGTELKNFDSLLKEYGIEHVNGIIVEGNEYNMYQSPVYLIPEASASVLTDSIMEKNLLNLFPQTTGFTANESEDISIEEALKTSASAYAKKDTGSAEVTIEKTGDDIPGPFCLSLYVNDGATGAKLAVFGTANIFADQVDARVGGANTELLDNALSSMIESPEGAIASIPAKSYNTKQLTVSYGSAMILGFLFIILLPFGILFAGIALYLGRRKK